jgi:hypothetical protein
MRFEDLMNFGSERIDLSTVNFTPELLQCIPGHVARRYRALPIYETSDCLGIASAGPPELDTVDSLPHILKRSLEFRAADEGQLGVFLERLYGSSEGEERR